MPTSENDISILIIDDNPGDQLLLEEGLYSTDLSITEIIKVDNLSTGKKIITKKPFSLVFLDLFLPDSNGLESFTDLQKTNPAMPIVILSGLSDKKVALKAIALGAQDFLIKGNHTNDFLEKTVTHCMERKKNMESVKATNERHETLLKVTNDILWDWDLVTNLVTWSGNGLSKYLDPHVDDKNVPRNFWLKRLHNDERKTVLKSIYTIINTDKKVWQSDYRFLRNNGKYDHIHSRGYILVNDENEAIRMIGSMQDITERKLADEKLIFREKRFQALIQNSADLISLLDKKGNYLYVSDSVVNILGYEPISFIGKNTFSFIHVDDIEYIKTTILKMEAGNFIKLNPIRFRNKNGEWRWLESTLVNRLNDNALDGIIVNSRDITTRIEAEQQLKEAMLRRQKEVTEAIIEGQEKERSEIGRELHDNINQLLVATKLYIEMGIKTQSGNNELLTNAVTYIMLAIEEIRKLSKILVTPFIKEIGFTESIKCLAEDIMHVNPIIIKIVIDGFDQEILNEKFKLNIFRIVQEQINNILKHSQAKHVNILLQQSNEHVCIFIIDDGIGFDPDIRMRGVGISNIYSRAALYKGNVIINSTPGNGCIMHISFNEIDLLLLQQADD